MYQINPVPGGRIPYQLNIIDTPGIGLGQNPQGMIQTLKEFLKSDEHMIVDCIALVAKASDWNDKEALQKVTTGIQPLIGKIPPGTINLIQTFVDANSTLLPQVLKTLGVQCKNNFVFNNACLYTSGSQNSPEQQKISSVLWGVCQQSEAKFLNVLDIMPGTSLVLNKDELDVYNQVNDAVQNEKTLILQHLCAVTRALVTSHVVQ